MKPWNKHRWPEWKNQFQLFLATLHHLEDGQKVTLFRDSLGPDGLAIACKLFPELENYNATAKDSRTFALVWWQFHEHCWARYIPRSEPAKDLLKDRMKLRQICGELMEKVSLIFIRPYVPLHHQDPLLRLSTTSFTNSSQFCLCASWSACSEEFLRWNVS